MTEVKVNYHVLNNSIVLNWSGKTETIANTDGRYSKVILAIKEGRLSEIPKLVDLAAQFEGTGLELKHGQLWEGNTAIPTELNDRILRMKDEGLPFDSLLKFWDNLKLNPSFNARKMMFAFLAHNGHPLTDDGCFIAYRGVTEDFKDVHTQTFDNKPGSVCEMPRDQVDDNPNNTCSNGLHVACYNYAKDFGSKLVEVKVNPVDVVCVPVDYNGTKMRVCKFEVVTEAADMRTESVYGVKPSEGLTPEDLAQAVDPEGDEDSNYDSECPDCGYENDPSHSYCGDCGEDLN